MFDEFMLSINLGKDNWNEKSTRLFWDPILNATVELVDKLDRDRRVAQYTPTNFFSTSYVEKAVVGSGF